MRNLAHARLAFRILGMVFGLAAAPLLAQTYDVVGLVQDEERGEPVGQVEIALKSGKVLGYSKSNGRFEVTVNSHNAVLVFKRHPFTTVELDLSDLTELIDIEVTMQSAVIELADKDTTARRTAARVSGQARTMEELELMQGMRIDLNDHLRQLPGVSGMNEFTNDISVWGSRTQDVTHYLGQSRIPSLRHLDVGFPGNQSVLNPRLLKSITLSDNLAKGPLNQGNASALVYDLKEGDPNNITGDVVFGTVNRELNLTGYWGGRTFIMSGRYLEPTFLANLGDKFYTDSKDARLDANGKPCTKDCKSLDNPFEFRTMDGYVGTFYRDSTGAYSRHSVIGLDDEYKVQQDVSEVSGESKAQTLVEGTQDGIMYAYEAVSPGEKGDLQWAVSVLRRNREEAFRDTLPPTNDLNRKLPWYQASGGEVQNLIGDGSTQDLQFTSSFQWNPVAKLFGAAYGYGLDMEYLSQDREFRDLSPGSLIVHPNDYLLGNGLARLKWNTGEKRTVEAALGASVVYQDLLDGPRPEFKSPAPLASLRYTRPLFAGMTGYGETAIRANTALLPTGLNRLEAVTTSSAEVKLGVEGGYLETIRFTANAYSRVYKDPVLPMPEVFWNYEETHKSDYAYANGGNLTMAWLPSHHFGMNVNASSVQGDYHLEDTDGHLPWESNRTLDLVSNIKILPRRDSLLSFIITYTANNDAPLYEYTGLYDNSTNRATQRRTIGINRAFPTVSRQRTDMRLNLDLKSKWRPLESMRFFFEADNIFSDYDGTATDFLGGANRRKRGWTRSNANGDLLPVVTKGMGLFIMFGFEGKLLI